MGGQDMMAGYAGTYDEVEERTKRNFLDGRESMEASFEASHSC